MLCGSLLCTVHRQVQLVGLGLATAVLVDPPVIRRLLLPAALALLGRLNWWLPAWLDRRLPALRPV